MPTTTKTKRTSKPVAKELTAEDMHSAISVFAASSGAETSLTAQMEEEIKAIHLKYAPRLEVIQQQKAEAFETVQAYCTKNKEELFKKGKSFDTTVGSVGFRTGKHTLKPISKMTWDKVLTLVKVSLPDYVRTIEEVAKDKILADRHTQAVAPHLATVGLRVVQEERFFIELKPQEQ